jgi:hypothetical protein
MVVRELSSELMGVIANNDIPFAFSFMDSPL